MIKWCEKYNASDLHVWDDSHAGLISYGFGLADYAIQIDSNKLLMFRVVRESDPLPKLLVAYLLHTATYIWVVKYETLQTFTVERVPEHSKIKEIENE